MNIKKTILSFVFLIYALLNAGCMSYYVEKYKPEISTDGVIDIDLISKNYAASSTIKFVFLIPSNEKDNDLILAYNLADIYNEKTIRQYFSRLNSFYIKNNIPSQLDVALAYPEMMGQMMASPFIKKDQTTVLIVPIGASVRTSTYGAITDKIAIPKYKFIAYNSEGRAIFSYTDSFGIKKGTSDFSKYSYIYYDNRMEKLYNTLSKNLLLPAKSKPLIRLEPEAL
jgi:hypothetical protein